MGSLTNSYKFKPGGLMKKTFSVTIAGVSQHLISYYKIEDVEQGRLRSPSTLPELACLDISPEYLDKTHFRNPPKVEMGIDGIPRYRGEADDVDATDNMLTSPLSSGHPLPQSEATSSKRPKRFDPYTGTTPKRTRKTKNTGQSSSSPTEPAASQSTSSQSTSNYPESTSMPPPSHYPPYAGYYQVSGYPMHPPPHPHTYSNTSPPTTPQQPQQQSTTQHQQQYGYPAYPASSSSSSTTTGDSSQTGQSTQQPYYPYYPPPHGHYPNYSGGPWPHYAGYPPPHIAQHSASSSIRKGRSHAADVDSGDNDDS